MIELLLPMMSVAAKAGPLTDVNPFKVGACRQNDIGKLGIAFEPDRLTDNELQIG